jgi:hypothetical protein
MYFKTPSLLAQVRSCPAKLPRLFHPPERLRLMQR